EPAIKILVLGRDLVLGFFLTRLRRGRRQEWKFRFEVSATALIPEQGAPRDDAGQLDHVSKLADERNDLIGPTSPIADADAAVALLEGLQFLLRLAELVVVADDRDVRRHQ